MAEQAKGPLPGLGGPQPQAKSQPAQAPAGENITYLPGPEDPSTVKWFGKTFHANVPLLVTKPEHIEMARGNKFFKVGSFNPSDKVPASEEPGPKTSDQYVAHAIAWLKKVESVDELDQRWASEETLRMACGVGSDDIERLGELIGPKREEMKKRGLPG